MLMSRTNRLAVEADKQALGVDLTVGDSETYEGGVAMRHKVFIPEVEWEPSHNLLSAVADVVVGVPGNLYADPEVLAEAIRDMSGVIITSQHHLRAEALAAASSLKVVAKYGTFPGDHVDLEAATRHGIIVCYTGMANADSVAEHTVALILAHLKRIPQSHNTLINGAWRDLDVLGRELMGKIVGVVGFGGCGGRVVEKLRGFDVKICVHDPNVPPDRIQAAGASPVSLTDLLEAADIVTLHVTHTDETHHMIGARELGLLKPSVLLVNTARGGLIDEKALIQVLSGNGIAGAALDVFEQEPLPADSPLLEMDNVLVTPHYASCTEEAYEREATMATQSVLDVLEGRRPSCVANQEVLKRLTWSGDE